MKIVTFKGGIHPPDSKEFSAGKEIKEIWPKAGMEILYPMVQHIGAPCEPIVAKGDRVLIGQKIGEAKAFVCAPIHASISGIVTDIRPTLTPTGVTCQAVVVEDDGKDEESPDINKPVDYKNIPRDELINIIKEAGIVGLGGAGFPTHIKLNPPPEKKIHTILVNAAECEPFLTTDHRCLLEESAHLIRGVQTILHLHPEAKAIIGIEINKMDALNKLEADCKEFPNIEVVGLQTKYPQGAEKQLILACTGKEVPSGKLPADIGCIVDNVDTVIAIDRAINRGRPLMRKVITISGDTVVNPGNYKIRLGMKYSDLLEEIGGFKEPPAKFISGGPMMGMAMFSLDVPMIKTSSALLCFSEEFAKIPPERNCIRCGKCVEGCPAGLLPLELNQYILYNEIDMFKKYNGTDCIECGSCSYVCPSKRHLAQSIRATRRDVLTKKK